MGNGVFGSAKKNRRYQDYIITCSFFLLQNRRFDSFEIHTGVTGVRQGDELSLIVFNCVLEKVIRQWLKLFEERRINNKSAWFINAWELA